MTSDNLFRAIFLLLFLVIIGVRVYFNRKLQRQGANSWKVEDEAVEREGKRSILARLGLFIFTLLAVSLYALNPSWLSVLAIPLPDWLRWFGVGLGSAETVSLIWVHETLGRHWSTNLQLHEGHQLITDGPYRWVRHPMYTALGACFIGLGLISAGWVLAPLVIGGILVLSTRIGREEQMMVEQFGQEYRDYMNRTGRFLPRLT